MKGERVGVIGVGLLGSAISERLIEAGFDVLVFDTDADRLTEFSAAASEREVAETCRTIVLSLPNSDVVATVVDRLRDSLSDESRVIDTTTGSPDRTVEIAHELNFVDATIAGSSAQARVGEVVAMVGGTTENYEHSLAVLNTFCRQAFHVGPLGSGAKMKLIVNLVLGLNRAVLAEALALARHCDMDLEKTLDVLKAGAAYSAVMDTKGQKMIDEDFAPQARLSQHLKDVRLILDMAEAVDATTPLSKLHLSLLTQLEDAGHGDEDNSVVLRAFGD